MSATLPQIQSKLDEARELRRDALDTVRLLALGRVEADRDMRLALVSKFDGYEREFWALVKVERELIASGRIHGEATSRRQTESLESDESSPLLTESRSDAPPPLSAVITLAAPSDAQMGGREGPRNEASKDTTRGTRALPSAGEVF